MRCSKSHLYSSEFLATLGVSEPFNGGINHVEAIPGTASLAVLSSLFIPSTIVWKTQWNCTLFRHLGVETNLLSLLQKQIKKNSAECLGIFRYRDRYDIYATRIASVTIDAYVTDLFALRFSGN